MFNNRDDVHACERRCNQEGKKNTDDEISVKFKEYTVPHVYQKYAVEIFVKSRKSVKEVLLNDNPVQWRYNNRGFVTISSSWAEGDEIMVRLWTSAEAA